MHIFLHEMVMLCCSIERSSCMNKNLKSRRASFLTYEIAMSSKTVINQYIRHISFKCLSRQTNKTLFKFFTQFGEKSVISFYRTFRNGGDWGPSAGNSSKMYINVVL